MSNNPPNLTLTVLPYTLAICRLTPNSALPDWAMRSRLLSITRTNEELSVVCEQSLVPHGVRCEPGWRALQVAGPLDFSLTGILAALLTPLAKADVSVFTVSTFDTDYLFFQKNNFEQAIKALRSAGHKVDQS